MKTFDTQDVHYCDYYYFERSEHGPSSTLITQPTWIRLCARISSETSNEIFCATYIIGAYFLRMFLIRKLLKKAQETADDRIDDEGRTWPSSSSSSSGSFNFFSGILAGRHCPTISFITDNGRHAQRHRVESFVTPVHQPGLTAPVPYTYAHTRT